MGEVPTPITFCPEERSTPTVLHLQGQSPAFPAHHTKTLLLSGGGSQGRNTAISSQRAAIRTEADRGRETGDGGAKATKNDSRQMAAGNRQRLARREPR